MKEFTIPLKKFKGLHLPIIHYNKIPILIDTGATIPVFSIEPSTLINRLNAKLVKKNKSIFGFGGKASGDIYSLPRLMFGKMVFKDSEVFVPHQFILENIPIILSASMFYGTYFGFDTINGKFVVKMKDNQSYERTFKIKEINGILYPVVNGVLVQTSYCNFQSMLIRDKKGDIIKRNFNNLKKTFSKDNSHNFQR